MKKLKQQTLYQQILSPFLLAVYLFVALFSPNFHNHGSGEVFRDFHFKKAEKTVSSTELVKEFTDCLSCHLMHDGKVLIPQEFSFKIERFDVFQQQQFAYKQRFGDLSIFGFCLRGPPSDFI